MNLPVYFRDILVYRTFHVNKEILNFFLLLFVGNTDDD